MCTVWNHSLRHFVQTWESQEMKQDRTALNAEHFRMSVDLHRPISLEILLEWVFVQLVLLDFRLRSRRPIFGFPETLLLVRLKTTVPKQEVKPNTSQERKKSKGSEEPKGKTLIMILFFLQPVIGSLQFSQRTYKDQFLTTNLCDFVWQTFYFLDYFFCFDYPFSGFLSAQTSGWGTITGLCKELMLLLFELPPPSLRSVWPAG